MSFKKKMRDWLNPLSHYDTGSINCDCEVESYTNDSKVTTHSCEINLNIRDCSRSISLNLSCDGDMKQIANRKKKLDILRKHIDNVENCLDALAAKL